MSDLIPIPEHLLISVVRYGVGRRTYIVGDTVNAVAAVADRLSPNTRQVIVRDIAEALDRDAAGDPWDVREWERLHRLLNDEGGDRG